MKNFAFISDFDGTLTDKDFYKIVTEEHIDEETEKMLKLWKNGKINVVDYLGYVFKNINKSEEEIYQYILKIIIDPSAKEFIQKIIAAGGDFIVVSAGTSYYIKKAFENQNINGVKIYSNEGIFKDKGIHFVLDKEDEFYSEIHGIDKYKVVKKLKEDYTKIFYAGDSEPDLKAALIADVVFAKASLIKRLEEKGKACIPFESFSEIWDKIKDNL